MNPQSNSRRQFLENIIQKIIGARFLAPIFLSTLAGAQNYPSRPIRMISPFTTGGGTDLVGRMLADGMSKDLGQSIVYENKPGGGTVIGSDIVAKAAGDGYTLLLTTSAHAINASLVKNLPFDIEKSFSDVALICRGPNMLVTKIDSPYKTIKDVLEVAKANPGKLTYGSSGNGSAVHLAAELFKLMAKVDITHIPYRGAGPAYTDLMGGQIDFVFATSAGVGKFIEANKMRAIAVTSAQRSPSWPQIPTIAETGISGYEADVWYALFASGNTPPEIINRLNLAARNAANAPSFVTRIEKEGITLSVSSPEELSKLVRTERDRWRKVVTMARVTID